MTSKVTHTKDSKDGLKKRTAQLLVSCNVSIRLMKTVEGKICWDVEDDLEDFCVQLWILQWKKVKMSPIYDMDGPVGRVISHYSKIQY